MEGVLALPGAEIRMLTEKAPIHDKGLHADPEEDQDNPPPPQPKEAWTAGDQPYVGTLEQGQFVHYWSETHHQWIFTEVVHTTSDAGPVDLSIKANANRSKIRYDWEGGYDQNGKLVWLAVNSKHRALRQDGYGEWADNRDFADDLAAPRTKKEPFMPKVGDAVQYWSPTFGKFIGAQVKAINKPVDGDGEWTVDLNVKKRAPISSLHPPKAGTELPEAAPPQENTPRQLKDVPDRSQTPLRAHTRREDRAARSNRTSYIRSTTAAPNSSRSRGDPEEKNVYQRTAMDPGQLAVRQSAQREMSDASPAAFDTSHDIAPSAIEVLARPPAAVGPTGYPSSATSYAPAGQPAKFVITAAGNPTARLAGPSTARKPDLKPVPEMSVASSVSGDASLQVSVRAGQDVREPSRLSIASAGSSLASPVGASTKATPSFAPPPQYARSLSASTSSLSSALPSLREQLRVPMERVDVAQISAQIVQALGGPAIPAVVQRMSNAGGGQNMGIWTFQLPPPAQQIIGHKVLIVKMVQAQSSHRCLPSEADSICKVAEACPAIREDPKLTFPIKVLDLVPPSNRVQYNLMVMPEAKGNRLAEYFCMSITGGRSHELMEVLKMLGRELKMFHQRYNNRKHADFTPSNIFYDASTKSLTFIDLGGVGTQVMERDDEHFIKSLQLTCGPGSLYAQHFRPAVAAFQQGYMSA
jgi:hypothetical protein